ncbi:RNA-directed DNA polymerase, eukaryota [Tanacetum coccineum]
MIFITLTWNTETRKSKSVPIKVNVLAWKVMVDALPTRWNLSRRGITIPSILCPICGMGVESSSHVFFRCEVTRQISKYLANWWNIPVPDVESYNDWKVWLDSIRFGSKLKDFLEGVWYTMWWYIWWYRNKMLFDDNPPKKSCLFDRIVASSFQWCNSRCKKLGKILGKKIGKRIASSFNKKLENLLTQLAEKGIPLDKTPVVGEEDEEYEESDDEEMEVLDEDEEINDGDDSVE